MSSGAEAPSAELRELALAHGVQLGFRDVFGRTRRASAAALVATLATLGVDAGDPVSVRASLRHRRRAGWARASEPVAVAWEGRAFALEVRVTERLERARVACRIELESGGERSGTVDLAAAPVVAETVDRGRRVLRKRMRVTGALPLGYHRLEIPRLGARTLVISAPRRAPGDDLAPAWGVFLPLHALRSATSQGIGDLSDLRELCRWVGGLGGSIVGTLPILASFATEGELYQPSPYAPASRVFWNELHVDVTSVPELERSAEARALLASDAFRAEVAALNRAALVDVPATMACKRRVLELLARSIVSEPSDRRDAFGEFERSTSELERYAAFRAACDRRRSPWQGWPARERDGHLARADRASETARYHRYVQWIAREQLEAIGRRRGDGAAGLALDLPLGAHRSGFDTWRWPHLFAIGATGGAPPDAFFSEGQAWGCPPLHPQAAREDGYAYQIACLRHLLGASSVLRIDHVMGLHRLFWVPDGFPPAEGVYVRYPADELYAILALEAHRTGAPIVGEDLGTVPAGVVAAMDRHGLHHTYAMQFRVGSDPSDVPDPVPAQSVAMLNTHDMAPFASFARGTADRVRAALRSRLGFLAGSDARLVLVNLEDLWGETRAQNVPGTTAETNWRRRARYPLERFERLPEVVGTLGAVDRLRRRARSAP